MQPDRAERVAQIVEEALERSDAERLSFVEESCGDDTVLRTEVISLLSHEQNAKAFIEEPGYSIDLAALADDAATARIGQVIGNHKILSLLGEGGMGEVYLAEDLDLGRKVALKLVRSGFATRSIIRHFRAEERILAALNHPNIARLYGGGVTTDGVPYFVMEYVDGERLDLFCSKRELSVEARIRIFQKVCAAVSYAHQHLVIHRDLKPANIRVTPEGEPKLLDFGIAKLLDDEASPAGQPTMTLGGAMTPEYCSPEQVAGLAITTASDVYSLGVVLYELLTTRKPYELQGTRPNELSRVITEQIPPRPSTVFRRGQKSDVRHRKSLRGDLDNIVLMAMRKDPTRRYGSVSQFSEDLRRHLNGLPVLARQDTVRYRVSKFVYRNKIGVAATVLVLFAIIAGLTTSIWQTRVARRERTKAEAVGGFLQEMLFASDPRSVTRERKGDATLKDVLDEASRRLAGEDLSTQPEVKAALQRIIGASYLSQGQYDLAERNLTSALEAQKKIYGADELETLKTLALLSELWGIKGDYAKADRFYQQNLSALRAAQQRGTVEARDYLMSALFNFALARRALGDSKKAEVLLREEVAFNAQALPKEKLNMGTVQSVLALTLADQGKFDEAEEMVRSLLASLRQQLGNDSSGAALSPGLTILGGTLMEKGELDEAEANLREAEAIYRKLYDRSYVPLGDNLRIQAQTLYSANRFDEAEAKIKEALDIYRASAGQGYINYPTAVTIQGLIYSKTNRATEAEKLLRDAVEIRRHAPEAHFLRAVANGALGEFLTAQKRFPESEPLLLESYASLKQSQDPGSRRLRLAGQRLAELYMEWQKPELAAKYRMVGAE
ncbi:MAG: protein kinase [Verrucomicrobiota bacterium]|nr:protein kinase [Verrucomicrobiota bacterium]